MNLSSLFQLNETKVLIKTTISVPLSKQSRLHGRPQKFFQGGQSRHFLILFRLLTMQCKSMFTKRFTLSTPQRKCPMLRQQSQKLRFVGSNASFSLMLLFTPCKTRTALLTATRSYCLAALPAKLSQMSAFKSHMRQYQGSHSEISKKPRLFMKKKHLSTKKNRNAKKHMNTNTLR